MFRCHVFRRRRIFVLFICGLLVFLVILLITQRRVSFIDGNIPLNQLRQSEYVDGRGMHVIVAHYYATRAWESSSNLSQELSDINEYSPVPGEGENGEPVYIPLPLIGRSKKLYEINKFNLMASDRISVHRKLSDLRKQECKQRSFTLKELPKTSVIIVFHNEAWSTLLRTVHSVINQSPSILVEEIILVDDASTKSFLGDPLNNYIAQLPVVVRIIRTQKRIGLIKARIKGAEAAVGQVLTFLDAHCECTTGWLEPLLQRIAENRTHIACPIIDIISDETFAYLRSFDLHWGAINWNLHFRWLAIGKDVITQRKQDSAQPFKTPVMAGGLFSVDKSYFNEIGQYDPEMSIWGGENIEMSFRVWMCGGSVEIVPCSRVGHVFRQASPYNFPGGVANILQRNLARVAEVWMDEWKHFFYKLNPEIGRIAPTLNVTNRLKLRNSLNCKSFSWYLENIWPQHFFPTSATFFGKIRNKKSGHCLQRPGMSQGSQNVGLAFLKICAFETYAPQLFVVPTDGYIMSDEAVCLGVPNSDAANPIPIFLACQQQKFQQWKYSIKHQTLVHKESNLCLDLPTVKRMDSLSLQPCSESTSQKWHFEQIPWK